MQQQQQLVLAVAVGFLEDPFEGRADCFHLDTAQLGDVVAAITLAHQHQQLFLTDGEGVKPSEIPSFLETQIIPSVRVYKRCCFR